MATNKTIDVTNVTVQIPGMTDKPNQSVNSNCIDKIIDGLNALNSKLTVKVESVSGTTDSYSAINTGVTTLNKHILNAIPTINNYSCEIINNSNSIYLRFRDSTGSPCGASKSVSADIYYVDW